MPARLKKHFENQLLTKVVKGYIGFKKSTKMNNLFYYINKLNPLKKVYRINIFCIYLLIINLTIMLNFYPK